MNNHTQSSFTCKSQHHDIPMSSREMSLSNLPNKHQYSMQHSLHIILITLSQDNVVSICYKPCLLYITLSLPCYNLCIVNNLVTNLLCMGAVVRVCSCWHYLPVVQVQCNKFYRTLLFCCCNHTQSKRTAT